MYILMIGLKNKTISDATQKRFVFQEKSKGDVIKSLKNTESISEVVILETPNRTEIYTVVDQLNPGRHYLHCFLSDWFGVDKRKFTDSIYIKKIAKMLNIYFE